jgi:iron complex outermembrane recepter protein
MDQHFAARAACGVCRNGIVFVFFVSASAWAQQGGEAIDEVVVIGDTVGNLGLDGVSSTGSRLGLSVMETPASVEVIDSAVLRARGYQKVSDAVQSLPGVIAGDHPAGYSFAMRGFSRAQINILRDGLWIGPSDMVTRPQNTFNLDRIEVLRGPASVLYGIGAVGSTVNTIGRTAAASSAHQLDVLASYGSFDSYQFGVGTGGPLGDALWYRVDLSRYAAEGYVDGMEPSSTNLTSSLLWHANDDLTLKFSIDALDDDLAKYFGTPLVPLAAARQPMTDIIETAAGETIDEAMRFVNYNVADGRAEADQLFLRADIDYRIGDRWELENSLYSYDADREWVNAEGYAYCTVVVDVCTSVGDVQRYYGYFFVFHDQDLVGDRFTARLDESFGRMRNRFLAGAELVDIDFSRSRGFRRNIPPAPGDSVDPYHPIPGVYGPLELRGVSPTQIETRAVFAEDALDVTSALTLVFALRYEEMNLDRKNFNATGVPEPNGFVRDYDWWSWRAGAVYRLTDDWVVYGQYSDASDPINSNVFLVNAGENFDLTDAEQWEVGLKASLDGGRTQVTLAYFDITRDDIIERFALDSTRNIGSLESRGIEIAATLAAGDRWRIGANAGYTDAEFSRSANVQLFAGNRPPNVPELTANAWASVSDVGGLPLELGFAARYVDERFGDNANAITFKEYALFDAYAAWTPDRYRVSLRVDNLTDEPYIAWSDIFYLGQTDPSFIYANQVMLGAPRTYSVTFQARF